MEERLQRIKTLLLESDKIAIFLAEKPREEEFLLKESLRATLENLGKKVFSFPDDLPEFKNRWAEFASRKNSKFPEKIFIRLPKKFELEEILNNNEATLVLAPEGEIQLQDIKVEKGYASPEVAVAFLESKEALVALGSKVPLPEDDRMIFLGSRTRTLSEKLYDLIKLLIPNGNFKEATLLYAALLMETGNFSRLQTPGVFGLAKNLLEAGADQARAGLPSKTYTAGARQLLGRALARSQREEGLGAFWSFLPFKDFEKTHLRPTAENLKELGAELIKFKNRDDLSLLLWEDGEKKILGFASGPNPRIQKLALAMGAAPQSDYFALGPFANFSEAERKLRELLKENQEG